ncbi:unnamed protein product [Cunninghamella echinulata]
MNSQQVFSSEKDLEAPFMPVKRVNIKDIGLETELKQTIFEHCIKKGQPLVLTGFNELDAWDTNLFNIDYFQKMQADQELEVYEQGVDIKTKVTWNNFIIKIKQDSDLESFNTKNNKENCDTSNINIDNINTYNVCNSQQQVIIENEHDNNSNSNNDSSLQQQRVVVTNNEHDSNKEYFLQQQHMISLQSPQQGQEIINSVNEKENLSMKNNSELVELKAAAKSEESVIIKQTKEFEYHKTTTIQTSSSFEQNNGLHENKLYYGKDLDCPEVYTQKMNELIPKYLLPLGDDDLMKYVPENLQAINLLCYLGGNGTGTPFHCDISGALGQNVMTYADSNAYSHWLLIDKSDTEKLRQTVKYGGRWKRKKKSSLSSLLLSTSNNSNGTSNTNKANNDDINFENGEPSTDSIIDIMNISSNAESETWPIRRARRHRSLSGSSNPLLGSSASINSDTPMMNAAHSKQNHNNVNNNNNNNNNGNASNQKVLNLYLESERAILSIDDLKENGIKTYVIVQKPGDMVIIPSVCYHQVINVGISFKIAWNRMTAHSLHEGITKQLPLYKRIGRPETYRCSATIYFTLKSLILNGITIPEEEKQYFIESYQKLVDIFYEEVLCFEIVEKIDAEEVSEKGIINDFKRGDPEAQNFDMVCDFCQCNIFHRYYQCKDCDTDLCLNCYANGRTCRHPTLLSMRQATISAFKNYCCLYFDAIKKINTMFGPNTIRSEVTNFETNGKETYPLATICRRIEKYRKFNDLLCNQFYCFHCHKTFSLIQLQLNFNTNIFQIFKRRPCTSTLPPEDEKANLSRIFSCPACSIKCENCQPLHTVENEKSSDVFYFNDDIRNNSWYGGSHDNGLFQSACYPDYGVMMNDDKERLADICEQKSWSYPEDFFNLAAAALIRRIQDFGWEQWGSKNTRSVVVNLIRNKAEDWTKKEESFFSNSLTLKSGDRFIYKEYARDKEAIHKPLLNTLNVRMSISELPIIDKKAHEKRGRKRKYL